MQLKSKLSTELKKCLFALSNLPLSLYAQQSNLVPAPFLLGANYQLPSDLDDGSELSRASFRANVSVPFHRSDSLFLGGTLSYQFDSYDFSDNGILADPWGDIQRARFSLVGKGEFSSNWSWLFLPNFGFNQESGALLEDSFSFGAIGAAWSRLNDALTIGGGFVTNYNLEDKFFAFPILVIDWNITETLSFTTMPPPGLQPSPSASLNWQASPQLTLSLIYQYQIEQQRLSDSVSARVPNGIGELRQHRLALSAGFHLTEYIELIAHGGYSLGGTLELLDPNGREVERQDLEGAAFFGVEANYRF